jgi:hypothetical protein
METGEAGGRADAPAPAGLVGPVLIEGDEPGAPTASVATDARTSSAAAIAARGTTSEVGRGAWRREELIGALPISIPPQHQLATGHETAFAKVQVTYTRSRVHGTQHGASGGGRAGARGTVAR